MTGSFVNRFVIAMPSIIDPFFGRSIIYIFEHNNEYKGTRGLIINKPFIAPIIPDASTVGPFIHPNIYRDLQGALDTSTTIFFGGPIEMMSKCIILHSSDYNKNALKISNEIYLNNSKKTLQDIKKNRGPKNFRFILGFVGWRPGQLEEEIKKGEWLLKDGSSDFIFNTPDDKKWEKAISELGLDIALLTINSVEA